jgi:hypothetical protein
MKRSGYIVSVQFFVDADPNVPVSMTKAFETMDKVAAAVRSLAPMKMSHQFVRRHEVPGDAAAGKEEGPRTTTVQPIPYGLDDTQLPIPAALDRRGAKA